MKTRNLEQSSPNNDREGHHPDESSKQPSHAASRKRAAKACLACRARKVRCDVSQCGTPCRNCRVNGGDCIVVGRPTKYRTSKKKQQREHSEHRVQPRSLPLKPLPRSEEGDGIHESNTSPSDDRSLAGAQSRAHESSRNVNVNRHMSLLDDMINGRRLSGAYDTRPWETNRSYPVYVSAQDELDGLGGVLQGRSWGQRQPQVDDLSSLPVDANKQTSTVNPTRDTLNGGLLNEICGILGADQPQIAPMGYSRNSLVKPDDFSQSPPQDVEFLKAQGCFQVPVAPALEEFMRRYFIHVHPHLPMLDESAFWGAFDGQDRGDNFDFPISIFTFQAMLFACCSFVPLSVLHDFGFESIREARQILYRRGKLLFDFKGKRDPMSMAQGALLLSYSPDTNNRKDNSFWLGVAIQNARDANAHAYDSAPVMTEKGRNARKRLFWCCILRDRILPLGLRRPIYITDAHFEFSNTRPLNAKDLENEMMCSKVYDPETKRSLAELVASLCELAVVLTDVIMILSPVNELPVASLGGAEISTCRTRIRQGRSDLTSWYEKANVRFPTPAGLGESHESVILYTNLMYLYYHSARMALCHHELLISKLGDKLANDSAVQLHRSKAELQEAAGSITDIMKELLQLRLVKYLPISTVAYIALPLVLNILDVKLSRTESQYATRQRRLQIFMDAMRVLQSHYDGTDRVSDSIERLIGYLAINNRVKDNDGSRTSTGRGAHDWERGARSNPTNHGHQVAEWGDVLVRLPNCYLRIAITLDLAFSKGEFPDESDFPPWLRTSRLANSLPLYRMSQWEGGQSIASTSHADNSARVFDRYYDGRNNEPRPVKAGSNFQTCPQSYPGETIDGGGLQLGAVSESGFDGTLPERSGLDDIQRDTNVPEYLQLDAWMFDVFQDFH